MRRHRIANVANRRPPATGSGYEIRGRRSAANRLVVAIVCLPSFVRQRLSANFDYSRRRKFTERPRQRRDAPEIFSRRQFGNLTFIPGNHSIKDDVCESNVKRELQAITSTAGPGIPAEMSGW